MELSIVDTSQVTEGGTAVDALRATGELAVLADRLGYARYWLAEHHGAGRLNASSSPEVMIARVASLTTGIRVGSGTVLLNHHSAFRIAETFRLLHSMFPGRIDLGIGRANGMPAVDLALQRERSELARYEDYGSQIVEVLTWFDGSWPDRHPFADVPVMPGVQGNPEPWVLGSTPSSAAAAGELGLPYCFAAFINPRAVRTALDAYRRAFTPSPFRTGLQAPRAMVGINVSCAETEEAAARLRASVELFYQRLSRGEFGDGMPLPGAAVSELGGVPEPTEYVPGEWPRQFSAAPARLREMLEAMAEEVGADGFVLQDLIASPSDRQRSYELIADTFELEPRAADA
ncbi:LLM class flavin-dependent oxidoreductase [Streptomyces xiaopingdaonensis]|uniref:LLM class flavin-dependent oxidoreductase n=1 Tax=Streptomyces xiaopingdaonensis TaxID=1565415 RepID=UPI000306A272|nr:LLM class flavin-dependent oxidoreductase [Streptomyces xiaopingdaonensis]